MANERLLDVRDLKTYFDTDEGTVKAVDGVSFHINRGETLAVVGESGSGKSVTSLSIMRLIAQPPGRFAGGEILFDGSDLLKMTERQMRKIRGNDVSMIFQEPMTSLNPVYTVGDQIGEAIVLHQGKTKRQGMKMAAEMLDLVGIPEPEKRVKNYPHQMSGRDAPARDDRDGALLRAAAPHRRRADDRPGRDHPGADSGPHA